MPVYMYRNLTTGETFEVEQRITESAFTVHPETGDPVKRLVQPVGIAFRGSGFYVTDSRGSGGSKKGSSSNDSSSSGSSSDGASAASKGSSGSKDGAKKDASKTPTSSKSDSAGATG